MTDFPTPPDCSGDAAAYVLGALEPAEAEAFRRHLESCVVCRDEVAAFERVVDVLPAAVPQYRASDALRHRVVQEARGPAAAPAPPAPRPRRLPRLAPRLAAVGAMAAAALVLVVVLVATAGSGTRVINASVTGPGSAQVRVRAEQAELVLRGFRSPPRGEVYEVWLQRAGGRPIPTGTLFSVTARGAADIGVAGRVTGVREVMVTAEPAGGSRTPTHPPVLVARLT